MSKKKNISITDILKGKFLVDGDSLSHWKFIAFLALLALISIVSSHQADRKVKEISKLQNKVSNIKSEYAFVHKKLMQDQMRSHVAEMVIKDSIKSSDNQPYVIIKER